MVSSSSAQETLVTSLIHYRLDYCNVIFAGLPSCDLRRLQLALNSSVRLVAGARKFDHVTPLLWERLWLPIAKSGIQTMHTCIPLCLWKCTVIPCRSSSIDVIYWSEVWPTVGGHDISRCSMRCLSFGDRAFSAAGPRAAWNSLSSHVRSVKSMSNFRKLLTTQLFQLAYM